jgi:hypothetical protein
MNDVIFAATLAKLGLPIKTKTLIALGFSLVIALICLISFGALVVVKILHPEADVGVFLNVFLTQRPHCGISSVCLPRPLSWLISCSLGFNCF